MLSTHGHGDFLSASFPPAKGKTTKGKHRCYSAGAPQPFKFLSDRLGVNNRMQFSETLHEERRFLIEVYFWLLLGPRQNYESSVRPLRRPKGPKDTPGST
jgi:hypothetical protein